MRLTRPGRSGGCLMNRMTASEAVSADRRDAGRAYAHSGANSAEEAWNSQLAASRETFSNASLLMSRSLSVLAIASACPTPSEVSQYARCG